VEPARTERIRDWFARNAPGVLLSITVGMAATFVSNVYGADRSLRIASRHGLQLHLGGIAFRAWLRHVIALSIFCIGVAPLGGRITFEQIIGLGWPTIGAPSTA
jgi:hypothetical protein